MRVAVECICLFLIQLASSQNSNCTIRLGSSECDYHKLLYFKNMSEILLKDIDRILIYHHHFVKLKEKQRICLLKKIFQFYKLVLKKVFTSKVPAQAISTVKDHLQWLGGHCLKCRACKKVFKNKIQVKGKYNRLMNMNGTTIINYQLQLLKMAQKKIKSHPAEIQEKVIYELAILWVFLDTTSEYETARATSMR